MTQTTEIDPALRQSAAHDALVAGLRNTHALEKQAIAVLEAQLKMVTDYPDLHARISEHIVETREQARRLEAALEFCGASTSMIKDALLSVMGLGQSSVAGFGEDAELKAVTADIMQEHLEIATYRSLLTLADLAGKQEIRPRLEESLREEEAMAAWLDENLEAITRRFVDLKASEQEEEAGDETPDGEEGRTPWYAKEPTYRSVDDAKPGPGDRHEAASEDGAGSGDGEKEPSRDPSRPHA